MGLEGVVSKRAGSLYKSGRSSAWLKTKCMTESEFIVVGMEANPDGVPFALLAREEEDGLVYAGSAFVTLGAADRDRFWTTTEALRIRRQWWANSARASARPASSAPSSASAHVISRAAACSGMPASRRSWYKLPTMCGGNDNNIAREAYEALFRVEGLPASDFPPRYNVTDRIPTASTRGTRCAN